MLFKYDAESNKLIELNETDFTSESLTEPRNIEEWIRKSPKILTFEDENDQIMIIGKQTVSTTQRRPDLIGVDRSANIVIIEVKRDFAGKMTEMQAVQYASFYLNMTFKEAEKNFVKYISKYSKDFDINKEVDISNYAETKLKEFLPSEINLDDEFNTNQRIILVAREFDSNLISAITWLILKDIKIECIELNAYKLKNELFIVPRRILPTKELSENLIKMKVSEEKVREKLEKKRTKYDIEAHYDRLKKPINDYLRRFVNEIGEPTNFSDVGFHLVGKKNKILISTWMTTKFEIRFSKAYRETIKKLFERHNVKLQLKDKATFESWAMERPTPSVDFKGEKSEFKKLVNVCKDFLG